MGVGRGLQSVSASILVLVFIQFVTLLFRFGSDFRFNFYHALASPACYGNSVCSVPSHTRTVKRECCKGDDACQLGNGKFDPLSRPNPLTDHQQKLRKLLRHGYLPTCKISSRSLKGFLFPVCAKLRIKKVYSTSLFFQRPTAQAPEPIFRHNTSNDAVPRILM